MSRPKMLDAERFTHPDWSDSERPYGATESSETVEYEGFTWEVVRRGERKTLLQRFQSVTAARIGTEVHHWIDNEELKKISLDKPTIEG